MRTFESLKSDLVKCVEYEKTLNKVNLKFHIDHRFWIQEWANGNVTLNWNDWLKDNNFGSERNVRRKRELAQFIKPFPRLQCVNISLNEFHRRKKDIKAMFAAHPHLKPFWKSEESSSGSEELPGDEALLEEMEWENSFTGYTVSAY